MLKEEARVLTIYANHLGGNLACKRTYSTITFDVMGESDQSQTMSKSLEQMAKSVENCITSNHSPYFLKLPKQYGMNHLIF